MSKQLARKWKVYVIHHSHTDIGYTERQEKIERFHGDFIRQVVRILNDIKSGKRAELKGFRWVCETFWQVEKFLAVATADEIRTFEEAIRDGDIELSGTYLNMNELISGDVLKPMLNRSVAYGQSLGVPVRSAMIADINGLSWGYAQEMADAGIEHFLTCIHPLHGIFPLGRKQTPFWWKTPKGDRLLVWNNEYYHMGNELGLVPNAVNSYVMKDEFKAFPVLENHHESSAKRIFRYLRNLEDEGYPYSFVPTMVSGLITDNSPPYGGIVDYIREWNAKYGDEIEMELTTLSPFFDKVKQEADTVPIPEYEGDWPDWWSDGLASTPHSTQLFREAQRKLQVIKCLDPGLEVATAERIAQAERLLALYSEHTWGYSSSIEEPWNNMVLQLGARKEGMATQAHQAIMTLYDDLLEARGEALLYPERPLRYRIINTSELDLTDYAQLYVDYWEFPRLKLGLEVKDVITGEVYRHQVIWASRGNVVVVEVPIKAGEEKHLEIVSCPDDMSRAATSSIQIEGTDGVRDIAPIAGLHGKFADDSAILIDGTLLETPYVRIEWVQGEGIVSWLDKRSGKDLIRDDRKHAPFTPVYDVTPVDRHEDMVAVRRAIGRNRKGKNAVVATGHLIGSKNIYQGSLFATVELQYKVAGTSYYAVHLTAYAHTPRVDVSVRFHKDSVWEPENLYISLPFGGEELWIEKTGIVLKPHVNQLPGTGTDFYCLQEGFCFTGADQWVAVAMPDTPLLQTGPVEHHRILLHGHPDLAKAPHLPYAWTMTNYWETNFKATVGGFYEFKYSILWGNERQSAERAIQYCRAVNAGLVCYRSE
ncbi:glycoside hydrolase [Cohnella silvisoli]|uniref:Glycoside hydrolase n=1 Tax=Cohnella silvisoli TaxID=2873699 RepID=A0ABV1KVW9_9BACL|nr:glycoside hydrolase [Cohnella silvisoli]MCD9023539.1 glycoside hydrolase [Cohnella silvisoli]